MHAHQAIMIVQSTLLINFLPSKDKKKKEENLKQQIAMEREFKDRIAVLTIAYHNLGVEQEYLKKYHEAVESYRIAADFSEKYLGSTDAITLNLKQIFERAKKEIFRQLDRQKEKQEAREAYNAKQIKLMGGIK